MNDNHDNKSTSNHTHGRGQSGQLEATAKATGEAVGIPDLNRIPPTDNVYHQHPTNAHYQTGLVHDMGEPKTQVRGGAVTGKFKHAVGVLTGNNMLKAEGLDDEALALNRSNKQSHTVEEMRATRDKALDLQRRAQELRKA